jgi:hypothetical protein
MISHHHKCIFVHIPKTAGTSIEKALLPANPRKGSDHSILREYRGHKCFSEYFKFSFVRNPWARVYSVFNYYRSGGNNFIPSSPKEKLYNWFQINFNKNYISDQAMAAQMPHDFEEFCCRFLRDREDFYGKNALGPQVEFLSIDGHLAMDFIGRFESLHEDWLHVTKTLGIESGLGHHRRNNKPTDYRVHYSDHLASLVGDFYVEDLKAFNYRFDSAN